MLSTWRLLNTGKHHAAMNMAIDEAILLEQPSTPQPTLRFYDWLQPAFSFGYFQQVAEEVDVAACGARGIELVRRMTGGGTVIHSWDVTYAIVIPHGCGVLPKEISAAYSVISDCLMNGLQRLGIDVQRQIEKPGVESRGLPTSPPAPTLEGRGETASGGEGLPNICLTNPARYDVMRNGKKIAGVSQRRNQKGAMCQGYIALDMPPLDVLVHASKLPHFDRVAEGKSTAINIRRTIPIDRRQLENAVASGFEMTLGVRMVEGELSSPEIESADNLAQTKYATAEWNFRR